jgi:hypothetical protein
MRTYTITEDLRVSLIKQLEEHLAEIREKYNEIEALRQQWPLEFQSSWEQVRFEYVMALDEAAIECQISIDILKDLPT